MTFGGRLRMDATILSGGPIKGSAKSERQFFKFDRIQ
jgi:hypothetical protein